jgi:glucose-6-phosphate isomerase
MPDMLDYMPPFTRLINLRDGTIPGAPIVQRRRLSDLKGMFADAGAENALLGADPILYEVYEATENPAEIGHLRFSTTIIHPGQVGSEYFMTKGHYHAHGNCAEVYYGLSGEGYLLLQTPEGKTDVQRMIPGAASYVPPFWGHRTMNVGAADFVFLAVYPADAGYDYESIVRGGFVSIVVERDGKPQVVPNPRYSRAP